MTGKKARNYNCSNFGTFVAEIPMERTEIPKDINLPLMIRIPGNFS